MLQGRLDIKGHDVGRVKALQARKVLRPDSSGDLADLLPDLGFACVAWRSHRYPVLPGWCGILPSSKQDLASSQ